MKKYISYYFYYLETLAKRLSGRGLADPENNGEFNVLENVIKNSQESLIFIDGG